MTKNHMTPGVYIEEKNAFPSSAVSVETAVPVFIGYTEKAEWNGKSLVGKPTRITSFAEYVERFGGGFHAKFQIIAADSAVKQDAFSLSGNEMVVKINDNNTSYLFNSMRLFYGNGGGPCYILPVDTFKDKESFEIMADDFIGSTTKPDPFEILKKEFEPTLVLVPDAIALGTVCYNSIYTKILDHCSKMQSRFGIFDLVKQLPSDDTTPIVTEFREKIGMNDLKYGAAYYPWLKSSVVQPCEITFENLDASVDLATLLPATDVAALAIIKTYIDNSKKAEKAKAASPINIAEELFKTKDKELADLKAANPVVPADVKKAEDAKKAATDALDKAKVDAIALIVSTTNALATAMAAKPVVPDNVKKAEDAKVTAEAALPPFFPSKNDKLNYHQSLKATSPAYNNILEEIRAKLNELPPSAAMAGLYTAVDSNRGVWKSPANISVNMVNAPSVNISSEQQDDLNVDVVAGKSINVIRTFPGIGTLVWGARTLDGNSQDWRYINVRRTLIMIEQSMKLSIRSYVFEPNDANTWITVKSMMTNFLTNLWKQGALAGAAPEQAFDVQIGLGTTMTPTDILDGKMLITVKVAIVRPTEFIVITFQQQMQQS